MAKTVAYPRNTVWYVEARPDDDASRECNMGSGVVVCLKRENESPRKYLLTCSHVVRSRSVRRRASAGPILQRVFCWPPGKGFVPYRQGDALPKSDHDGIWTARVIDVLGRPATDLDADVDGELPELPAGDDWVLLDVAERSFQDFPAVHHWGSDADRDLTVIGFPSGSRTWRPGSLVESYVALEFRQGRSSSSPAMISVEGPEETAGGMSGGGIFDADDQFVGLHRSQTEAARFMSGVRATHIAQRLAPEYEVVNHARPKKTGREKQSEAMHDFGAFLADYKSLAGITSKAFLAAPFLDLVARIGPLSANRALTAFIAVIVQFALLFVLFECNAWGLLKGKRLLGLLAIAAVMTITCAGIYSRLYNTRVVKNAQKGVNVVIGTELTEVAKDLDEMSNEDLLGEFAGVETDVWTVESIESSKTMMRASWIVMWSVFAILYGSFVLLQRRNLSRGS